MPQFTNKTFKTILNKLPVIDSWFWCRYSVNPYNGCLIACTYCDSRSIKYHMPNDFENDIIIKTDPQVILQKQITKSRSLPRDVVVIGGTTDGYQAAEKKFRNTRNILQVLRKYKFPVHIITKSDLVLEDIDLLKQITKDTWCTVSVTITSPDDDTTQFLEKRAISVEHRFELVKELRGQGIQSGVLLIPLVPLINDGVEQLKAMVQKSVDFNANYLLFGGGMTLRDAQAKHFLANLKKDFPDKYEAYKKLYQFTNADPYDGLYSTPSDYLADKNQLLRKLCEDNRLPFRIPRYLPRDHRQVNYQIAENVLNDNHLRQLYGQHDKDSQGLAQYLHFINESILDIINRSQLTGMSDLTRSQSELLYSQLKGMGYDITN